MPNTFQSELIHRPTLIDAKVAIILENNLHINTDIPDADAKARLDSLFIPKVGDVCIWKEHDIPVVVLGFQFNHLSKYDQVIVEGEEQTPYAVDIFSLKPAE